MFQPEFPTKQPSEMDIDIDIFFSFTIKLKVSIVLLSSGLWRLLNFFEQIYRIKSFPDLAKFCGGFGSIYKKTLCEVAVFLIILGHSIETDSYLKLIVYIINSVFSFLVLTIMVL